MKDVAVLRFPHLDDGISGGKLTLGRVAVGERLSEGGRSQQGHEGRLANEGHGHLCDVLLSYGMCMCVCLCSRI